MKKFVVLMVILILLAGAGFFFGWMNLWVPAGAYGVMVSKTSGQDETLIGPQSGFVWRWQHLIPTNVTLHVFKPVEHSATLVARGRFPSGEVYSRAAPFAPDFSYEINFTVSYRLRPQALAGLVKSGALTADAQTAYLEKRKDALTGSLLEDITALTDKGDVAMLKDPFALEKTLLSLANERSTDVELTRLAPSGEIRLPDPAIYYEARRTYQALIEEHRRLELDRLRRAGELFAREDMAFDRSVAHLERYGELLNKYPVLLKYLYLTRNPPPAGIEVPELKNLFPAEAQAAP